MKAPILVQNVSSLAQTQWIFCGLPESHMPPYLEGYLTDGKDYYPYHRVEGGIRFHATVPANSRMKFEFLDKQREKGVFVQHPAIGNNLIALLPTFYIGTKRLPTMQLVSMSASESVEKWHLRTQSAEHRVTVDLWANVYSGLPYVDFTCEAVYGDVRNDGQLQSVTMPEFVMECAVDVTLDFAARNGLNNLPSKRHVLVASGMRWHRAVRFQTRGAIHAAWDEPRSQGYVMYGLYTGWDGEWMALGVVPQATPDTISARATQYRAYKTQSGTYTALRPRTQTYESGTTGEQTDFGCASDLAVTTGEPWEIHDALWQCQSYAQRPTANKEPFGMPMQAELHPQAELLNQRPDLNLGVNDRLGWPGVNQIGWIPSPNTCLWTTSDDQHRSDNFLHATYALTRDDALRQLIEDHIELDKLDVNIKRDNLLSPRAVGRLALTRANQVWLGFTEAAATLKDGLRAAMLKSYYTTQPSDAEIRTIGGHEPAKYGWNYPDGRPIIGWQPWQETIAAIGFLAASRVLKDPILERVAKDLAVDIVANGFLKSRIPPWHAYAIRWNGGKPFSESEWPAVGGSGDSSNLNIYVSGACDYWTVAACVMLPNSEDAQLVLGSFGAPKNIAQSRWRAL